jgi:hypothetical protein
MFKIIILFILFNIPNVYCQHIPSIEQSMIDSSAYDYYSSMVKSNFAKIKSKPNDGAYQGVFIGYYWLNSNVDTTWRHLSNFVSRYPIEACDLFYVKNKSLDFDASIAKSPKGKILNARIKPLCDSIYNTLDSTLIELLVIMEEKDQKFRNDFDSPLNDTNQKKWEIQDSLDLFNRELLADILKRKGYPHRRVVGQKHEAIAWNIIQHGDVQYIEKYFPLINLAVKEGNLDAIYIPYMIDKLAVLKGIPQQYGTQLIFNNYKQKMEVYYIDNLDKVEARRKEYYLYPLKKYMLEKNLEIGLTRLK